MSADLAAIFGSLQQHHVATPACPLPPTRPGISWIWAANGIFKRGIDATHDVLICVQPLRSTPGLVQLIPHVRFSGVGGRIPGGLLTALLEHARQAGSAGTISRPIEQQYFITYRQEMPQPFRLSVPPQDATSYKVSYDLSARGQILIDIHSHHQMRAYFSSTDDQDDQGLSISAVVGQIFDRPEICLRANVYGHRRRMGALTIFDSLPGLCEADRKRTNDADLND